MRTQAVAMMACLLAPAWVAGCVAEQGRPTQRPAHNPLQPIGAQPSVAQPGRSSPPAMFAFGGGSVEALPPIQLAPGVARARPLAMHPAAPAATHIWLNPRGQWRVRMTSGGVPMRFQGKAVGVSGPILNLVVSRMELSDQVGLQGGAVTYDFETSGYIDGFDFEVGGNGCVRFVTDPGTATVPRRTIVGAALLAPVPHFILCP